MKRQSPIFLSAAAFFLLTSSSAVAEEAVRLVFDWPENVKVVVTLDTTIVTATDDVKHTLRGTSTYILKAAPLSNGTMISETDHRHISRSYDGQAMNELTQWLPHIEELAALGQKMFIGQYLVSKEGSFVDLHDFTESYCERQLILRMLAKDDPKKTEILAECRSSMQDEESLAYFSYQTALAQASSDWTRIVSLWAGGEMVEREIYESKFTFPEDVPPEKGIATTDTSKFIGRFPCKKGGPGADCVRLELIELIDTGQKLRPLMEAIGLVFPALKQKDGSAHPTMGSLRRRVEIHILTEPNTLLPHWVEEIETIMITEDRGSMNPLLTSRKTHSIWTYEYGLPK